jgi:hypothetical protein
MTWLEEYRRALEEAAGRPVVLDDDLVAAVLDLAREVAHGTERKNAPLATFLAGQHLAANGRDSLEEALGIARELLEGKPDGEPDER